MNAAIESAVLASVDANAWRRELEDAAISLTICASEATELRAQGESGDGSLDHQATISSLLTHLTTTARDADLKGLGYLLSLLDRRPLSELPLTELTRFSSWAEHLTLFCGGGLAPEAVGSILSLAPLSQSLPESFVGMINTRLAEDAERIMQAIASAPNELDDESFEGLDELLDDEAPTANAVDAGIVADAGSAEELLADELLADESQSAQAFAIDTIEDDELLGEALLGDEPSGDELLGEESIDDESMFAADDVIDEVTAESGAVSDPGDAKPLSVAADELSMLVEALEGLGEECCPAIASLELIDEAASGDLKEAWRNALEPFAERFRQFSVAAQFLELPPLESAMGAFADNLEALHDQPSLMTEELRAAMLSLPECWAEYFKAPNADSVSIAFAATASSDWPLAFNDEKLAQWSEALSTLTLIKSRQVQTRDEDVSEDDVSLEIPADADRSVLDNLLTELPTLSAEYSELIAALVAGDSSVLEPAQRIAHTLKGSANTVGIRGIANLTHQLEDIMQLLRANDKLPYGGLRATLEESSDCLAEMSEAVAGIGAAPDNALEVYGRTIAWTNKLIAGEFPEESDVADGDLFASPVAAKVAAVAAVAAVATTVAHLDLSEPTIAPVVEAKPEQKAEQKSEASEAEASLRVPVSLVDKVLDLTGESAILLSRVQNESSRMTNVHRTMREGSDRLNELANELERLVDIRGLAMATTKREQPGFGVENEFDALEMEEYNELHTVARRIAESGADQKVLEQQVHASLSDLANSIASLEAVQSQLRDTTMQTRMVSVSTVTPRLSRAVRQTARMVGKLVDLEIQGENTLVDNELLQGFLDPLMHMLRNAVDHAIESDVQRQALGKPLNGNISLSFNRVGGNLRITCTDDGAGLNLEKIRARGIERGLIKAHRDYTETEISRLILEAGFSTRDATTQVSGRGIGMDVVHQAVRKLRGTLEISSVLNKGTTFVIDLPLRLSSVPVLVARAQAYTLGLSLRGLEHILSTESLLPGATAFRFQDAEVPAVRLETLLGLPDSFFKRPGLVEVVLLVRDDLRQLHAIVSPELAQTQHVILKPLSPLLGAVEGVEGAAVLGDGTVAPVCDLPELISVRFKPQVSNLAVYDAFGAGAAPVVESNDLPVCLIVDDSVSVRRSMELFASDLGFQIETASDGLEALGKLQRIVPSVMLVDLEMPRMNGVELTASVRQNPRLAKVPVIMITSRYTEKHKNMAMNAGVDQFLTKPYTEDELASHIHRLMRERAPEPLDDANE